MPSGVSANYRYKLLVEGNCYKYKLRSEIVEKFKIPLNIINKKVHNRDTLSKYDKFTITKINEPIFKLYFI